MKPIDFEDSMYFYYIIDIVYALRDLDDLDKANAKLGLESFIKSYRTIKEISDIEIESFSKFKT
ncbi:hypothetical protein [Brassicibacter mesophilus]|uniref:hypothetical protein n=1 Tax=Brassicibacter mesophilus TaxID=745119 RepID=UPI003D1B3928